MGFGPTVCRVLASHRTQQATKVSRVALQAHRHGKLAIDRQPIGLRGMLEDLPETYEQDHIAEPGHKNSAANRYGNGPQGQMADEHRMHPLG